MADEPSAHTTEDAVPPPPWQRPPRGTRARRAPLDREQIVDTALAILDRDGLDELSMRRIADELGTGAASLYWHVDSKDELLDLVFDRVIGELRVPDPDPDRWAEQLKDVARAMRDGIARHRDIVRVSMARFPVGPNALRFAERVLAILRAGGLSDDLAVSGFYLLTVVVNGFMLEEAPAVGHQPDADFLRAVSEYFASLPEDRFANLVAVADAYTRGDADTRFELLIDLFVDGLAARAPA
jgi:AcrR family transcriptional regulator